MNIKEKLLRFFFKRFFKEIDEIIDSTYEAIKDHDRRLENIENALETEIFKALKEKYAEDLTQ